MRRFEFSEGSSNKFWEIEQDGSDLHIRWGRIGTAGQSQTKSFDDTAKAATALTKLVSEKTGKGYAETAATGVTIAPAPAAANKAAKDKNTVAQPAPVAAPAVTKPPAPPEKPITAAVEPAQNVVAADVAGAAPAAAVLATTETVELEALPPLPQGPAARPPWLDQGEALDFDAIWKHLANSKLYGLTPQVLPSRRFPAPAPIDDARKPWLRAREALLQNGEIDAATCDAAQVGLAQQTWARLQQRELAGNDESDALLLALALELLGEPGQNETGSIAEYLIASRGLLAAVELLLRAQRYEIAVESKWLGGNKGHARKIGVSAQVSGAFCDAWASPLGSEERVFRRHLASADAALWRQCVERIEAELPSLHPARQVVLAMLLPDAPEVSDAVALRLAGPAAPDVFRALLLTATAPAAITAIKAHKGQSYFFHNPSMLMTLLQERRLDILPLLTDEAASDLAGETLRHIGLPEAVLALARVATSSKSCLVRLNQAAARWPLAAIAALSQLVAADGRDATIAAPLLSQLLQRHGEAAALLREWLPPAQQAVLQRLQGQLQAPAETAANEELPRVLADPPWLKPRRALASVPGLAPLDRSVQESWDAAEREKATQLDGWRRSRYNKSASAEYLVKELGFEDNWTSTDKAQEKALRERAIAAVKAGDAAALIEAWRGLKPIRKYFYVSVDGAALANLPEAMTLAVWNEIAGEGYSDYSVEYMAARYGLSAWPGVFKAIRRSPGSFTELALRYADTELAAMAARAYTKLKTLRSFGREWLLRYPAMAAAALIAPALGKAGEARDCAGAALRFLAANGHEVLILQTAASYGRDDVAAGVRSVLAEDALDRFPSKRAALPTFWAARAWSRPQLRSNGKALSDAALENLGTMLAFPTNEEVYTGIADVREACTPDSLADFAWDLFNAWLASGSPSKDGWAMTALGWFGSDDTARRLTPLLRTWPGEGAHARAVAGLDVLAAIGSDVALMLLNGIAQKVKFKGLQDKAREKIDAIAEARGLSTEELEDRLAPDLGLDEAGNLLLDFGPRQFRVGFDEALKPYVRDSDGARLADLPKPKKSDDAELSAAAVERFKLLKKDARTIASQQVLRLEIAMCTRRRWSQDVFERFLATHPLLRHLVQRLVWGVYAMAAVEDKQGGTLQRCFRVAEDGSCSDADDNPLALELGENERIGLPHMLELPAPIAAAFGQLFADYELMQPFAQLGRDSYALTEAECGQTTLSRWKDKVVPTGRVLGLVNKGWRRGAAQDGGGIWYFTKPLQGEVVIELTLDPGIIVGMVDEYPEQKLQEIQVGKASAWGDMQNPQRLSTLDPIAASELIRDMQALVSD